MTDKTKSGWMVAGVGAAALAAVLGWTRDHWMPAAPQDLVSPAATSSSTPASPSAAITQGQTSADGGGGSIPKQAAPPQPAAAPSGPDQPQQTAAVSAAPQPAPAASAQPATAPQPAPAVATPQPAPAQQVASASPPPAVEPAKPEIAPTFDTVRVEKTGEAVVAGRAAPGSEVTLLLGDKVVGTAAASGDGSFVIIPDAPLAGGSGSLSLSAKPKGGNIPVKSEQVVAILVPEQAKATPLVAVVSPDAPTKVLQTPTQSPAAAATPVRDASLSLDAVDYDTTGNIVFSGHNAPGSTARVYVDNKFAGEAKASGDSQWSFNGSDKISAGVHMLRVDGLDGKGGVVSRVEVPFFREQAQKVASAAATDASTVAPAVVASDSTAASQPAAAPKSEPVAPAQPESQTASATAPAEPEKPKNGRVVIQPGNNLWRIATVIYGSGVKYTVLYGANKDQIRNPDLIYPGQIFTTPDVVAPEKIDPKQTTPLVPQTGSGTSQ